MKTIPEFEYLALNPCRSVSERVRDRTEYLRFQLPDEWTDRFFHDDSPNWISPSEYYWTPDSYFDVLPFISNEMKCLLRAKTGGCFFHLPLREQCKVLRVPLDEMPVEALMHSANVSSVDQIGKRGGTPIELCVYRHLVAAGWEGEWCECTSLHILQVCVQEFLKNNAISFFPNVWKDGYREKLSQSEVSLLSDALDHTFDSISDSRIQAIRGWLPNLPKSLPDVQCVRAIWNAMGRDKLFRLCELTMLGYGVMGWADILVHRNGVVRFIEVKRADRFSHRQPYWVRNYARPLDLDVSVLKVTR